MGKEPKAPLLKVRLDKWMWSVRIFKSRSKATEASKKGRIRLGEAILKPSSMIKVGDILEIRKDGFVMSYLVKALLEKRVSATLAQPCYDNLTPEEELNKFKDWFMGKAPSEKREKGSGRPTKRERREIDDYKDDIYLDAWFTEEDA